MELGLDNNGAFRYKNSPEKRYGMIEQKQPHNPYVPTARLTQQDARQKMREKIAAKAKFDEELAGLNDAHTRAEFMLRNATGAIIRAQKAVDAAKDAHALALTTALSSGADPGSVSSTLKQARADLLEAEDNKAAAQLAMAGIEKQLADYEFRKRDFNGTWRECRDMLADDVDRLVAQTKQKLLELVPLREVLTYLYKDHMCIDSVDVHRLLETLDFYFESTAPRPSHEWATKKDVSGWLEAIEKMKTDPDAKFPVIKVPGVK